MLTFHNNVAQIWYPCLLTLPCLLQTTPSQDLKFNPYYHALVSQHKMLLVQAWNTVQDCHNKISLRSFFFITKWQRISFGMHVVQKLANMCMHVLLCHNNHCVNCDGIQGPCFSTFVCTTKWNNPCKYCHPFHGNIPYSSCSIVEKSEGSFKCCNCHNDDLCSGCYIGGAHDSNHTFMKQEQAGNPSTFVSLNQRH